MSALGEVGEEGLRARELAYRFRDGTSALHGVSLALRPGMLTALWGSNGAGKSTLCRLLGGIERPASGEVRLGGFPLASLPPELRARRIAYLPQADEAAFAFTVAEVILLGRSPHRGRFEAPSEADRDAVSRAASALELTPLLGRRITALSGGERRRTAIARTLAQETPFLVLDEPLAGLDLRHAIALLDHLRGLATGGRAVVFSAHDLALSARYATHAALLERGSLRFHGPLPDSLSAEALSEALATPLVLRPAWEGGPPVPEPAPPPPAQPGAPRSLG